MLVFVEPPLTPPHTGQDVYHNAEAALELGGHLEDRILELSLIEYL